jgi:hypothetical protein
MMPDNAAWEENMRLKNIIEIIEANAEATDSEDLRMAAAGLREHVKLMRQLKQWSTFMGGWDAPVWRELELALNTDAPGGTPEFSVPARAWTDDRRVEIELDAGYWLEREVEDSIRQLAADGWGGMIAKELVYDEIARAPGPG